MTLDLNGRTVAQWMVFAPTDIERLFAQDEAIERGYTDGLNVPVKVLTNDELAAEIVALREARKLPFCDRFLDFIGVEYVWALAEFNRRTMREPSVWRELPDVA